MLNKIHTYTLYVQSIQKSLFILFIWMMNKIIDTYLINLVPRYKNFYGSCGIKTRHKLILAWHNVHCLNYFCISTYFTVKVLVYNVTILLESFKSSLRNYWTKRSKLHWAGFQHVTFLLVQKTSSVRRKTIDFFFKGTGKNIYKMSKLFVLDFIKKSYLYPKKFHLFNKCRIQYLFNGTNPRWLIVQSMQIIFFLLALIYTINSFYNYFWYYSLFVIINTLYYNYFLYTL